MRFFKALCFVTITTVCTNMLNRHEELVQAGSRVGSLVYSEDSFSLYRAACEAVGYEPRKGELIYAKSEAVEALLKHARGQISRKTASSIAGPSEDSFKGWSKRLRKILSVPDLSAVSEELLRGAIEQLGIALIGRPSYLTPAEAGLLVSHCCALSNRGLTVGRGALSAFGQTVLHEMAADPACDPLLRTGYAKAKCTRSWVTGLLKKAAEMGANKEM
jgi:hypothetical protein